jgi:YfiH family protein
MGGARVISALSRRESNPLRPVRYWTDDALRGAAGVVIAFTERGGGASAPPFESLNLASHVGDDPHAVDENRRLMLDALGLAECRDPLTMADQVHGERIVRVDAEMAGSGAYAAHGPEPVARTDALITSEPGIPLALCFADCVPVILVAPGPVVAVAHAGWRGALTSLPGQTALELARAVGCEPSAVVAYIGPHVRACHYEVTPEIMSQFVNTFGTLARAASGGLDLEAVVSVSLDRAGVAPCNIARLGSCTAETTDRFFSYRAEGGRTGRHSALACIVPR